MATLVEIANALVYAGRTKLSSVTLETRARCIGVSMFVEADSSKLVVPVWDGLLRPKGLPEDVHAKPLALVVRAIYSDALRE